MYDSSFQMSSLRGAVCIIPFREYYLTPSNKFCLYFCHRMHILRSTDIIVMLFWEEEFRNHQEKLRRYKCFALFNQFSIPFQSLATKDSELWKRFSVAILFSYLMTYCLYNIGTFCKSFTC